MRAALAVTWIGTDREQNLAAMAAAAEGAARAGADLVLFPEAATTGLLNDDHPEHDLPLGTTIPGPDTDRLAAMARRERLHLAAGVLERDGDALYDTALLFDSGGDLALKYRRVTPNWHARAADPAVYRQGEDVGLAITSLGRVCLLLCGDIFSDRLTRRVRELHPDLLLVPFERCFDDGSYDQARWDHYVAWRYARRARLAAATTLLAGGVAPRELMGGSFGGAMAISADGRILASWPLGRTGLLVVDL